MRVGGSIALGILGAILFFAVSVDVAGVSLSTVGIILMIGAGVWFLVELVQGFSDAGAGQGVGTQQPDRSGQDKGTDRSADQRP